MSEQEFYRLRQAVKRLRDAQEEASDAARQGLELRGAYPDYEEESSALSARLEEALADVVDILEGASSDMRETLGDAGEERGKGHRNEYQ